jgi:hypothetical protein
MKGFVFFFAKPQKQIGRVYFCSITKHFYGLLNNAPSNDNFGLVMVSSLVSKNPFPLCSVTPKEIIRQKSKRMAIFFGHLPPA